MVLGNFSQTKICRVCRVKTGFSRKFLNSLSVLFSLVFPMDLLIWGVSFPSDSGTLKNISEFRNFSKMALQTLQTLHLWRYQK